MSCEAGAGSPLRHATAAAAGGNVVGAVARALLTFAGGIFFARALGPTAMGDFALAAAIVGFAQLVLETGLGPAVVQRAAVTEADIRFVFTVSSVLGLAACVLSIGVAQVVATITNMPGAVAPAATMSLGLVALGASQAATALVRRRLRFTALQAVTAGSYLVGLLTAGLPAALLGGGAIAPAATILVQHVIVATWTLAVTRHAIRPLFRPPVGMLRFSAVATLANAAFWALLNLDTVVVASRFGELLLGLYSRAFFLAYAPVASVMLAVQGVLFSAASRRRDSTAASRSSYMVSLNVTGVGLFPLYAGLAAAPTPVVVALYGGEWAAAAEALRVLALAMPFMALGSAATAVLWARGRVAADLAVTAASALALLVAFQVARPSTLGAVATLVGLAYAVRWSAQAATCACDLQVTISDMVRALGPGLVVSAGVGLCVLTAAELTRGQTPATVFAAVTGVGLAAWLLPVFLGRARMFVPDAQRLLGQLRSGPTQVG